MSLKAHTQRQSLFLLHQNLTELRRYAKSADPAEIDRIVKVADLCSTSIKKLLSNISEEPANTRPTVQAAFVDIAAISAAISAVKRGKVCPRCGYIRVD